MKEKLAILGNPPAFEKPRSTSNLIKPNIDSFLNYIKPSYSKGNLVEDNSLIQELENRLALVHGSKYCIAVCNGLWGLVLAINELKLNNKTEIIMPSLTYRRMADIAAWLKMTPHYCDVEIKTLGISAKSVENSINEKTALILAPHPIVNLCDVDGLLNISKKYKLPILFDSVEASYACYNGKSIGTFGDAEVFSVHASKFLNGFEGGYITTNNFDLARKLKAARNFGIENNQDLITLGINGKMILPHAAMTMSSLDLLETQIKKNKLRFYKYKELLEKVEGIDLIEYDSVERRSFKNILVKLNSQWPYSREVTLKILQKENMVVRPYYFPPLHKKEAVYPTIIGNLPNTELLMNDYMLLPCGEFVDSDDIEIIVDFLVYIESNSKEIKIELAKNNN
ncbi:aminotransferase class I/II-fold pyridoxal phosphate-dependent enzyme [Flavobacteriaceae bacterium S0825]|uniref:aminotransferase class I/II-fold pyridoxal phosphate-dependent enzyme n=1 Tax=Gaetbulibacter sp. S0825 TaxID=2720084 RepID=UPI0014308D74|nr:aminotransferase class I/II-fold pyridoxal phosphate-dependent enzyme [Gaetbulibacter sp. S0825]MCK0109019.1 aminotransferase class I/II-fold pyridoxal phosphate-dependent enzyme [Flavobacteriaceae bacterium S0825]NIX64654.1 aminotransferase class I/II-fold pyridoxal phosphate-dependent enzyme [Gaetbulibacter sp. S0825]